MPYGDFINQIPALGFLAIHATAFLIGAYVAWRSFGAGASRLCPSSSAEPHDV